MTEQEKAEMMGMCLITEGGGKDGPFDLAALKLGIGKTLEECAKTFNDHVFSWLRSQGWIGKWAADALKSQVTELQIELDSLKSECQKAYDMFKEAHDKAVAERDAALACLKRISEGGMDEDGTAIACEFLGYRKRDQDAYTFENGTPWRPV